MEAIDYLQPIGVLFSFFVILFGAYYISRIVGRYQRGSTRGGNLTIIEAIAIGPQKTLQIVRVGKKYMVIGVSRDHVSFISEISEDELILEQEAGTIPFSGVLSRIMDRNSDSIGQTEESPDESNKKK